MAAITVAIRQPRGYLRMFMHFTALSLSTKAVIKPMVAIHSYDDQAAVTDLPKRSWRPSG